MANKHSWKLAFSLLLALALVLCALPMRVLAAQAPDRALAPASGFCQEQGPRFFHFTLQFS
jgi:putative hemolysin